MIRGGDDLERLYFLDDGILGVKRTSLGDEVFLRSVKRYEYAARHVKPGDIVLDCACGSGYGSRILLEAGASQVVGVDNDPVTIQYARKHYAQKGLSFRCEDMQGLHLPYDYFNLVVSIETIEHIQEGETFLKYVYRLLRNGGKAVVSTPIAEKTGRNEANPYHVHEYTEQDFRKLVESVFDKAEYYVPTDSDMPLRLTDQKTIGLIFAVGGKA